VPKYPGLVRHTGQFFNSIYSQIVSKTTNSGDRLHLLICQSRLDLFSLLTGKLQGNVWLLSVFGAILSDNITSIPWVIDEIPYSTEQGIYSPKQRNLFRNREPASDYQGLLIQPRNIAFWFDHLAGILILAIRLAQMSGRCFPVDIASKTLGDKYPKSI